MKFEIIYHLEGTRKVVITVPDKHTLPDDWDSLTKAAKDEWIYSRQSKSEITFEDIDHAEAVAIDWVD